MGWMMDEALAIAFGAMRPPAKARLPVDLRKTMNLRKRLEKLELLVRPRHAKCPPET